MKKILLTLLIANCSLLICFAQSGVLKEISGTVELKHKGAAGYVPANVGDSVAQDTIISTGLRSAALVEVGSTLIALRPLTRLTLTEIQATQGEEKLNVNLSTGRIKVDVNPPAGTRSSMAVSSPQSTASVRGTSFYFDTRNLTVDSGIVVFKGNRGYTLQVGAGGSSLIGWNSNATNPQYAGNRRQGEIAAVNVPTPVGVDQSGRDIGGGNGMAMPKSEPSVPNTPNDPEEPGTPGGTPGTPGTPGGKPGTGGDEGEIGIGAGY